MRAAFLAIAMVLLASCATADTVRRAAVTEGKSQDFSYPYNVVKAAALEAVQRLNVEIQGSDETAERFQIRFSKPVSAFSWGEVGAVNVVRIDEQNTRVFVNTEKRSQIQITGTSEGRFASEIFSNIGESSARLQQ